MFEGLGLVAAQVAVVVVVAALCAGLIGWLIGRSAGRARPAAPDTAPLEARVAELESTVADRERDLARLETGATTAWDTTVPTLEGQIENLREERAQLNQALLDAQSQTEAQHAEIERLRRAVQNREAGLTVNDRDQ